MAIRLLLDQFYVRVKIRWAAIVTDFQKCTEPFNNLKKLTFSQRNAVAMDFKKVRISV